ncbi:hypothetical protein BGX28_008601 [Mortierella sp. GBA30]|nr:hypothetical protein BGX28_008601 [Mortierella sp. GBA30]
MATLSGSSNVAQDQEQHHDSIGEQRHLPIEQISVFTKLPSELVLEIFNYLDIVTIFRFLDTCRYHRYLLLNMPEIWRKVRFVPLSEYASTISSQPSTTLSAAATAVDSTKSAVSLSLATSSSITSSIKTYHRPSPRTTRPKISSGSSSESDSSGSDEAQTTTNEATKAAHRLKHAESERDKDRGGSRSLLSEIYAVLRRFRKENRLIEFVREINMDATDSLQFPSPLVMLIKFPFLEVLSSRYRRNQTSLNTDTHTLKDMLRNGDIVPHSLRLRRWDIFHPYMTKEDVAGFKSILDAIAVIGADMADIDRDKDRTSSTISQRMSNSSVGVILDIRLCPGPEEGYTISKATQGNEGTHVGAGMHWATIAGNGAPAAQTGAGSPVSSIHATTSTSTSVPTSTLSSEPKPICSNIVWVLEKCRVCDAHQDRCYRCVGHCKACGAIRAPPYINHQTALERKRAARQNLGIISSPAAVMATTQAPSIVPSGRPRTPPGSISLTRMSNLTQGIASAYLGSAQSSIQFSQMSLAQTHAPVAAVPATLALPPEFSLFD